MSAGPAWSDPAPGSPPISTIYSDFFELARPGNFNLILFGGGFRSDEYATTQQGFQFEQSVTRYVGVVGRVSGYQLYEGQGFDNPLDPGTGHHARLNFARLQGGLDFKLYPGTQLYLLGGRDAGDSHASVIEADFSSWLFRYSPHPINFSFSVSHGSENDVTSSEIDLRTVILSKRDYMLFAGGSGSIYGGGAFGTGGEGGPGAGVYVINWGALMDFQTGYGSAKSFVQLTIEKTFSWGE
jgi:hypothetical protein